MEWNSPSSRSRKAAKSLARSRSGSGGSGVRSGCSRREGREQALVQAAPHLVVRIAEPVARRPVDVTFFAQDRQVAGLEQQRLRCDVVDVELREEFVVGAQAVEAREVDALLDQRLDQEGGRTGLEPVRAEAAAAEELQDVVGVVYPLVAEPVVPVCTSRGSGRGPGRRARARTPGRGRRPCSRRRPRRRGPG